MKIDSKTREFYRNQFTALEIDVERTAEILREVGLVRLAWTDEDGEFDGAESMSNFLILLAHLAMTMDTRDAWPKDGTRGVYFRSMAILAHALRELVAGKVMSTETAINTLSVEGEEDVYMLAGALGLTPVTKDQAKSLAVELTAPKDVDIH